ncbi:MAG: hypothetical protein ABR510_03670 [Trueperaceae bacterium]
MGFEPTDGLVRCPPFVGLGDDDVRALAAIARCRRFERGAPLFFAGDRPEGLHVMAAGSCRIYVLAPHSGREIDLATEHPSRTVAELPSLARLHQVGAIELDGRTVARADLAALRERVDGR